MCPAEQENFAPERTCSEGPSTERRVTIVPYDTAQVLRDNRTMLERASDDVLTAFVRLSARHPFEPCCLAVLKELCVCRGTMGVEWMRRGGDVLVGSICSNAIQHTQSRCIIIINEI